jgi:hypothetical protein
LSERAPHWLLSVALATLIAGGSALAGTPERDKAWEALIAEAKKHGGEETQYKTSVSYVFHKSDGEFVTFTRMLDSPTRAVCVMSKDQSVIVCGNWDTGKLKYGLRPDAHSSWTYSDEPPGAETSFGFGDLLAKLGDIMSMGTKYSKSRTGG